jgi:hypothetical protein
MHLSTALWVGIGAAVMLLAVGILFFRGSSSPDLGAVSDQWLSQHRATQPDDFNR